MLSLVLCGCGVLAVRSRRIAHELKIFWVLLVLIPVAGPLAMDALFGHFVANRQTMFCLPALVLLAASGLREVREHSTTRYRVLAVSLLGVLLVSDVRLSAKPHEDWDGASKAIAAALRSGRAECVVFLPADSIRYYLFFDPTLSDKACGAGALTGSTLVARSPYGGDKAEVGGRQENLIFSGQPRVTIVRSGR